jgi:GDP-L-fucose synthase
MKILITGGSGLVGHGFKKISNQFDHDIVYASSKDCDLANFDQTNNYIKSLNVECVIHLAANVGGLYKNMNFKVDMFEKNMVMNYNVLKACHDNNVDKFVGMLSTCIFPDDTTYPINERMLHDGPPHCSNDAYAYAKRMLDIHCRAYNEQYNTNYNCIVPTNIYGDNDNYNLDDAHVLPALIHKCYLAKKAGEDFETRGTGKPLRQFIHADDLARVILQLVPKLNQENVIVSPTEEYSIAQVATFVARAFDYEHALVFNTTYSDGQYKKTADNSKLLNLLPKTTFKLLETGVLETVEYFIKNYPSKVRI